MREGKAEAVAATRAKHSNKQLFAACARPVAAEAAVSTGPIPGFACSAELVWGQVLKNQQILY